MFWEKDIETMKTDQLRELQLDRLKSTLSRAMSAPFYKHAFESIGFDPESIKTLEDIRQLPFTTKYDL